MQRESERDVKKERERVVKSESKNIWTIHE